MRGRCPIIVKSTAAKLNGGVTPVTEGVHLREIVVICGASERAGGGLPRENTSKMTGRARHTVACRREVTPI
jgi:hypothetical protein